MVCLHPRAVTFSCVRSMNYLLSSQRSEYSTTRLFSVSTTTAPAAHRLVSSRLHMYGVCEARRRVLPSSAPAAHCGQVNWRTLTRHDHCHSHAGQSHKGWEHHNEEPYWVLDCFNVQISKKYEMSNLRFMFPQVLAASLSNTYEDKPTISL